MAQTIGSRYNTDATSDHGVSDDRCLVRMDAEGLTLDPDIRIDFHGLDFTLSAPWGYVTVMGGPTSRINDHDLGVSIDQESLLRHAHQTGQRVYTWPEMVAMFSG